MKVAYLDIETNYLGEYVDQRLFRDYKNHRISVVGLLVEEPAGDRFVQLVGESVTRQALMQALAGIRRIVTYNGRSLPDAMKRSTGFDFPVIAAQLGVVLDREFPHTDLVPECWKRNLYGGQKKVEQVLGLRRALPGKDGEWAMRMWRKYLATNDQRCLDELLTYNREDVFMLREIESRLRSL
ncbi:MAG TPA: ribonuclease H-like domain-containing protein [Candidatus Acidoferrales bacterium]|nr:ribonuclease H-like domain-containing protein [Candidatus Acidoferrales bacterium]